MKSVRQLYMKLPGRGIAVVSYLCLLGFGSLMPASSLVYGQTVSFGGTQMTLPVSGLSYPRGLAVDRAGDVFVVEYLNNSVVELPRTTSGYGPQITLPFGGLDYPAGVAIDSAGDVFVASTEDGRLVELPWTGTAYGAQKTTLNGLNRPQGVVVDGAGDVFVADSNENRVVELTASGYFTTLGIGLVLPSDVAVDDAGDVFITDRGNKRLVELPRTTSGYGPQKTLPARLSYFIDGVAVDSAGDLFIVDSLNSLVVELPKTETGYGPQTTLAINGLSEPSGAAVEGIGDVLIADFGNNRVVEYQTRSVNFGSVNVCAPGQSTPAPCREILTLTYNVTAGGALGAPSVLSGNAPDLPFTLAPGSTCTGAVSAGATCTVNVKFKPGFAGERDGVVQVTDASGKALASTLVYGNANLSGFTAGSIILNGAASIVGGSLELTDGGRSEASSAYSPTPVNVQRFTTAFDFQLTHAVGDGFTFTMQSAGPNAIGSLGGGLGFAGIEKSAAIKFDLYSNDGEGINSTGVYLDGAAPNVPAIDLTGTGIDLHSGDRMHASLSYDGSTLTLTITDLATGATWSHPFTVDLPRAVGGDTAYVGFTAGSGSDTAVQQILGWQFTSEE